jgi:hypothetical protein
MISTETQKELTAVATRLNYTGIRILPAPDKKVTEQQVAEDILFLLKEIENPTGATELVFTTKGK